MVSSSAEVGPWRDFALCVSLSNLCYLNVWHSLQSLETTDLNYFRKFALSETFLVTTSNVLLLSLVLWVSIRLVRRSRNASLYKAAQCIFFLLLTIPMRFSETYLCRPEVSGDGIGGSIVRIGLVVLKIVILSGPIFILTRRPPMTLRLASTIVLLLTPLFPVLLIHSAWFMFRSPSPTAFEDKPLAPPLPDRRAASPRILWLVFDEMDQRLVFMDRPEFVKLHELDRFRGQAIYAANAHPPARWTLVSMPALIGGKLISEAEPTGVDELRLRLKDSGEKVSWSGQPNVFSRAREAGLNTAVAGWYHPYCRVLNSALTDCSWQPYLTATESLRREGYGRMLDLARSMWSQVRRQLSTILLFAHSGVALAEEAGRRESDWERQQHQLDYLQIHRHALELVKNPHLGLILVHWPIPHLPHPIELYKRSPRQLTADYFENLALSDRALGEVRLVMERAGLWEQTSVLITSDHALRNEIWSDRTSGSANAADGRPRPLVPFLLKLPGQDHPLKYIPSFNTVLTHDLILALLRGELSSPESVLRWLDQNRARFPIS